MLLDLVLPYTSFTISNCFHTKVDFKQKVEIHNRAAVWIPPNPGYLLVLKLLICIEVSSVDFSKVSSPLKKVFNVERQP